MANDLTTSAQALDKTISKIVMNGNTYTPDNLGKIDVGEISSGSDVDFKDEDTTSNLGYEPILYGVKEDFSNLPDTIYIQFPRTKGTFSLNDSNEYTVGCDFHLSKMIGKIPELKIDQDTKDDVIPQVYFALKKSDVLANVQANASGGPAHMIFNYNSATPSGSNVSFVYVSPSGTIASKTIDLYNFWCYALYNKKAGGKLEMRVFLNVRNKSTNSYISLTDGCAIRLGEMS
ncbi:hypothetical protein [Lactobacillus terrae]|uniref:hypothetical protein n=1 Tax=Lactobacillus terrae TaxID=2269374 RepID=UPI000C1B6407|nr:hypothetical protein [Lactobacillus terrae]